MNKMSFWFVLAIAITGAFFTMYVITQQTLRLLANDPQLQISQDMANKLASGASVQTVVPNDVIDMKHSLAPFIIVFDTQGAPLAASGMIDGAIPKPPPGVFDYTSKFKQDVFTWEPKKGVRIATVVNSYSGISKGFVLSGRSMRIVEEREEVIKNLVIGGWLATLGATLLFNFLFIKKRK